MLLFLYSFQILVKFSIMALMKAQGGCYAARTVNRIQLKLMLPARPWSYVRYPFALSCRLLRWVQTQPAYSFRNVSGAKSSEHLFLGPGLGWGDNVVFLSVTFGIAGCTTEHGCVDAYVCIFRFCHGCCFHTRQFYIWWWVSQTIFSPAHFTNNAVTWEGHLIVDGND